MRENLPAELNNRALVHQFRNYLAIVLGFCDLLLGDLPKTDPQRADISEMRTAAQSALDLLPEVTKRLGREAPKSAYGNDEDAVPTRATHS